MHYLRTLFFFLFFNSFLTIPLLPQAGSDSLPDEVKSNIFSFIANRQTLTEALNAISRFRTLNRTSKDLLSRKALLFSLIRRCSCWTEKHLPNFTGGTMNSGLLQSCLVPNEHTIVFSQSLSRPLCEGLFPYLKRHYSEEEADALCLYLAERIRLLFNAELSADFAYFFAIKSRIWCKARLLDFIINEAEKFYSYRLMGVNCFTLGANFTYDTLKDQGLAEKFLGSRMDKFKLFFPFYLSLLKAGCIPLSVPALARNQIEEFAALAESPEQKSEVMAWCEQLAAFDHDETSRKAFADLHQNLMARPRKKLAVDACCVPLS